MSFNVFQVFLFLLYDSAKGVFFHFGLKKLVIFIVPSHSLCALQGRYLRWVILNSLLLTGAGVCVCNSL